MVQQNRRAALVAISGMWLAACGGGEDDVAAAQPDSEADQADTLAEAAATREAPQAIAGTPVSLAGDPPQFLAWDGGSGPTRTYWSKHLQIRWKNPNIGDWLDAQQTPQGSVPYTTLSVTRSGQFYEFPMTALVKRWLVPGANRGAMLRATAGSSATWSGREAAIAANRPVLIVKTSSGTHTCACTSLASFSPTSANGVVTRMRAKSQQTSPVIAQFDLKNVRGTLVSATMRLFCEAKSSTTLTVEVFEQDAPRFQLGTGGMAPTLGVAAQYPGDRGLSAHPDVIRAGDFSDLTPGKLFDSYNFNAAYNPYQVVADSSAPGTKYFRGSFLPSPSNAGIARGSFTGRLDTMPADTTDPLRPPSRVSEELFCRLYIFLEDDWDSTRDGNKMAIGWDLRMGWWNDAQGGYWQSTTGNGGSPGTGLKLMAPMHKNGGSQRQDRWEYQGHSIRMEAGKGVADGNPYADLRPMQSYAYNLDQPGAYGQVIRLGRGVIGKGRWHCVEQQIRMNSIVGPFDGLGNGSAVADGLIRTWLDGVLCSEVSNLRWRRHPEMGVQGPWVNWFYGGKQPTETPMHYRMNHFVLSRKYIGPRVG